ncbi:MAG: DUF4438 domain-containing protein [Balneolaceae bacterium]|nr:DUF4438 domain-containing protein [Balneolaceae bacterium]
MFSTLLLLLFFSFTGADSLLSNHQTDSGLTPLEVNRDQLVEMAVTGFVREPFITPATYRISPEGTARALPGTGSITYNFRVGDSAVHMAGDHVEPSVSITNNGDDQRALNILAQIGNSVRIISGDAKGKTGKVIGKHGGIENVMVEFDDEVYDVLNIGDRMQIRVVGLGMETQNIEDLYIRNVSPTLLDAFTENGMGVNADGKLVVPVTHIIPAKIMGSGLGRNSVHSGDYDIQMFDEGVNERYNLNSLRLGDIVAIRDADNAHGRIYREGAWTIGVVSHGISTVAGHGPGVTTLFTSPSGNIKPVMDENSNLKYLLNLRQ